MFPTSFFSVEFFAPRYFPRPFDDDVEPPEPPRPPVIGAVGGMGARSNWKRQEQYSKAEVITITVTADTTTTVIVASEDAIPVVTTTYVRIMADPAVMIMGDDPVRFH